MANIFKPSCNFLSDYSNVVFLLGILFVICVSCHVLLSVSCSLVVTCSEIANLLALVYVMFFFATFLYWGLGQVWYLIVWIPDLCLLPHFSYYMYHFI